MRPYSMVLPLDPRPPSYPRALPYSPVLPSRGVVSCYPIAQSHSSSWGLQLLIILYPLPLNIP